MIIPLAAGSTADINARILGTEFTADLGQPVVIDNKAGAGGSIAIAELKRAPADGYTLGYVTQGTQVFVPSLYSKVAYDPIKDFSPIGMIGGVSNVLVVPPTSKARTVAELISLARSSPGKYTYASGGPGTSHHLSGVLFAQKAGLNLLHVPYKGAPQGVIALMSGEVDMAFFNTPNVLAQIRSGQLIALATTGTKRSPLLPDVPTMQEAGVRDYDVFTWSALVTPANTPPEVLAKLRASLKKATDSPAVRAKLVDQGLELLGDSSPEALTRLLAEDLKKWPAIIKASGAKAD
ncbi:Bug family tripartite tricarboxylate transporter substrate binding protein [Caenimonas aquaedulcis]|uniref:Tripartite tricarboxylate transporter substrate binding protein n=1 Tax=Caenimonas aquaedulcis TaxID=2793270 RepID=A0A931H3M5_9BURK|nr:tripartite tricarboxylate transporter substrate binding protein [Caenimonas aquaedulcis]MBG9387996.1 tripartite tricarboxylate transporter substrate binding protein [Caenimonas aquaedulcis]